MNFIPQFSCFQVPVEMASSHLRRLPHGRRGSACIKNLSKTPSPPPTLLCFPGSQVSPGSSPGVRGSSVVTPSPAPGVFTFSCVFLQRQRAALAQRSGLWFLCTNTRATISLAAKALCVCPSTWGCLASSPKLAASKT